MVVPGIRSVLLDMAYSNIEEHTGYSGNKKEHTGW